jgi:hypothetical protein
MATVEGVKAQLILAAYTGACAVCEPLITNPDGKPVQLDPLIQDVGLQQKGVLVYEEAKVQYAAILRAFQDKSGIWPDPPVAAAGAPLPDVTQLGSQLLPIVQKVLPLLTAIPQAAPFVPLLQTLVGMTPATPASKPAAAPPKPPGSEIPAESKPKA